MFSVSLLTSAESNLGSHIASAECKLGLQIGKRLLVECKSGGQIGAAEDVLGFQIGAVENV